MEVDSDRVTNAIRNGAIAYYDNGYHTAVHRALIDEDEYFWTRARYSADVYFRGIASNARILEYGCGIGQNIALVKSAIGVDVSSEAREAARKRGIEALASSRSLADQSFDVVLCRHCLEHLEKPLDDLLEMKRLLKPGGLLRLILPKEGHRRTSLGPDAHQHLYCWNFRTINNLLHRCGLLPTTNCQRYILGFRRLLPLRRLLGHSVYVAAVRGTGFFFRNAELIIDATRQP